MKPETRWTSDMEYNMTVLIETAMEFKRDKNNPVEIFVHYYPHINGVQVDIFEKGWQPNATPDISETIIFDFVRYDDKDLNAKHRLETNLKWNKVNGCIKYWKNYYEDYDEFQERMSL